MSSFLTWVEQSALGQFVRESGPWTYPLINLAHIVGIAALFGSVLVIDLTLLGVGRRAASTMSAIADAAAPVARAGFLLAAASGVGLLSSNASEYVGNPFFMIKFPLIALALLNAVLVTRSAAWRAMKSGDVPPTDRRRLTVMAGTSLVCWTAVITAGRMIGYW